MFMIVSFNTFVAKLKVVLSVDQYSHINVTPLPLRWYPAVTEYILITPLEVCLHLKGVI